MFAAVAVLFANVALSSKRSGHASTPRGSLLPRRALLQDDGESLYPSDAFSESELKAGAIMLHVIGVLYTFTAIAIVCDDFFVPALEVLVERYDIEDDVAGATFMAAGGSAPELFTALIGVFIAKSNVGFGTIIGSAVFNVLFVIGACAFFSKEILVLTWWPLARDCTFYTFDLVMLYVFFRDQKIELYESILLLVFYGCYVGFMKFNVRAEVWFKSRVLGQKGFDAEARAAAKADALAAQTPGGSTDFVASLGKFARMGLRKGLLVVVSDFFDADGIEAVQQSLARQRHRLVLVQLVRKSDRAPELQGDLLLRDCESGQEHDVSVTADVLAAYRRAYEAHQQGLRELAVQRQAGLVQVDVDEPVVQQLSQLFETGALVV